MAEPGLRFTPRATVGASVLLVVAAALLSGLRAPAGVTAPVTLLALAVVVHAGTRSRGRGRLDALVVGITTVFVVLMATGFVLNLVPGGITTGAWAVAAGVVGVAVLAVTARTAGNSPSPRRPRLRPAQLGYVVGLVTAAAAIGIAYSATSDATQAPLALSRTEATGHAGDVLVQSGSTAGTYELVIGDADSSVVWKGPFHLAAHQQASFPVDTTVQGVPLLTLRRPGTTQALRTLVIGY